MATAAEDSGLIPLLKTHFPTAFGILPQNINGRVHGVNDLIACFKIREGLVVVR
jgi:hypothetical protein